MYSFKMTAEALDTLGTDHLKKIRQGHTYYLLAPDDSEKDMLHVFLFERPGISDIYFSCPEDNVPIFLDTLLKMNRHALFLHHKQGWVNEDFITNRITIRATFKTF